MRLASWVVLALAAILVCTLLSAFAIPFANSLCPAPNIAGYDLEGLVLVALAALSTLLVSAIATYCILRRAWTKGLTTLQSLTRVAVLPVLIPCLWFLSSAAYFSGYCPGYGKQLTPEQINAIKYG